MLLPLWCLRCARAGFVFPAMLRPVEGIAVLLLAAHAPSLSRWLASLSWSSALPLAVQIGSPAFLGWRLLLGVSPLGRDWMLVLLPWSPLACPLLLWEPDSSLLPMSEFCRPPAPWLRDC